MPIYGTPQAGSDSRGAAYNLTAVAPGERFTLFNAETFSAFPQSSVAFNRALEPGMNGGAMTFQMSFASAPTAVVKIQGSNVDLDAAYETLWTSNNTQYDNYTDTARWAYYRVQIYSYSAGGALTVTVQR